MTHHYRLDPGFSLRCSLFAGGGGGGGGGAAAGGGGAAEAKEEKKEEEPEEEEDDVSPLAHRCPKINAVPLPVAVQGPCILCMSESVQCSACHRSHG